MWLAPQPEYFQERKKPHAHFQYPHYFFSLGSMPLVPPFSQALCPFFLPISGLCALPSLPVPGLCASHSSVSPGSGNHCSIFSAICLFWTFPQTWSFTPDLLPVFKVHLCRMCHLLIPFLCGWRWDQTWGLMHVRQAFYHWSTSQFLFLIFYCTMDIV